MLERIASGLVAVSILLVSAHAQALDLNHHKSVTRVALKSFQLCLAHNKQTDLLTAGAHKIVEGAKLESLSPPLTRYFNWHFHDAHRGTEHALGSNMIGVQRSIHSLHERRLHELQRAITELDVIAIYSTSGRLLHHLQDMAVPANVAPIHHEQIFDLAEPDPFSASIMWKNPRYIWQRSTCVTTDVDIETLGHQIPQILDSTAKRTRNKLREQITTDPDHALAGQSWEALWTLWTPGAQDDNTLPGFSTYGHMGRDGFAELCRMDRELCESFFNARYADAVDASVKALLLINEVLIEVEATQDGT